jgi:hypothetical protein
MSKITFESVMEEIRANLGEARLKQIAEEEDVPFFQRPYANIKKAATAVYGAVSGAVDAGRAAIQKRVDMKNDSGPNTAPATAVRPAANPAPSPGAVVTTATGPKSSVAAKPVVSGTATPADRQAFRDRTGSTVGASTSRPSAPAAPNVRAPVPTAPAASTVKAPSSADEYSRSRNSGSDEIGGSAADLIRGDRAAAAERAAASKPMQENFEQFVMDRAKGKSS